MRASRTAPQKDLQRANDRSSAGSYNIVFILTDQERFFRSGELPIGYRLPARESLMKRGTTLVRNM